MIFKHLTKLFAVASALTLFVGPALADTLKGGVLQEDQYKNQTPGLSRSDLKNDTQGDPFRGNANDSPVDEMLQLPANAMDMGGLRAPAPPKKNPLSGNAQDAGNFQGVQQQPMMEQPQNFPPPRQQQPLQGNSQAGRSNDPDGSAEMQLLWDAWHKRVAEAIFTRFNSLAQMAFKHSPPLACQVSYMVARDGRVGNVQVLQKSSSPVFNTMLLGVINSMNGNPVLEYPPNSRRQFVEKTGTFTWNYGQQGFKFTTGDTERIQQGRQGGNMQQPMNNMNNMQRPNQMMQPMNNMNNMNNMQRPNQMMQQMQQPMQMMQQMFGH